MTIPLFDAKREFEAMSAELEDAALNALRSGRYILGPEVTSLERDAEAYLGTRHAVGCASGTDALWLGLRAVGVGPTDAVLTTGFSFFATASAIFNCGAKPVFCDIDPDTCNISVAGARAVLEGNSSVHNRLGVDVGRIKAIVPVHLYGQSADMTEILTLARTHGIPVVEDAAQAFGAACGEARAGTLGTVGCFSFFPTKNLGGFGDGGLVVTDDDGVADRMRLLRAHGSRRRYEHEAIGTNSRLDEVQAAMLRVRLRHVDELLARRREAAARYDALLEGTNLCPLVPRELGNHSFGLYVGRVSGNRDALREHLREDGIGTGVYYPSPLHLQHATEPLRYRRGDLPEAEHACEEVLALPMFPTLRAEEIEFVGASVRTWSEVTSAR